MSLPTVSLAALLLAGLNPVQAQTAPPTLLPRYEITAEREPAQARLLDAAQRRVATIPGGTDVIDTRSFREGRASNFQDFLQHTTGVYVASDNAGEASKISMRGSGIQSDEPLGVQVLLGGLSYNQADGEANLQEIDLSAVQGAEVYRGPNSLRFGGYVLGGAINLIPRTGQDSPGVQLRAEGGSFGFQRVSLGAGYARGDGDVYLSLAQRRIDGWREHSAEDTSTISANLGFKPSANVENRFYLGYTDWFRLVPGDVTLADLNEESPPAFDEALEGDFRIHTRSVRLADRLVWTNPDGETEAGLLFHRRHFLDFDLYERTYRLGVTDAESTNLGLLFSHARHGTLAGRPNAWIAGIAPVHEIEHSSNYRNNDGVQDMSGQTAASLTRAVNFPVYFENTFTATDRVSVVTGAQYVWIERKFEDRFWSDDDGDQSGRLTFNGFNPRLGVLFQRNANETYFANISRNFQPPSFDDLNPFEEGTNGSVIFTPLAAQQAWTFEIGGRGERGRIQWEATFYAARVRNELLELNDASGRDLGTVNVPHARHQGLEVGLDLELLPAGRNVPRLTLGQEYAFNDFRFEDDDVYGNNRIAGIPRHQYQAELTFRHPGGLFVGAELDCSLSGFWADQANTLKVGAYAVTGLKAGFQARRFTIFAEVRNLADRRYPAMVKPIGDARSVGDDDLMIFSPGGGRAFFAGVSLNW